MKRENWQKVKEIFDSASRITPNNRSAFLNNACGDNGELRREVETLLASSDEAESFMETPFVGEIAEMIIGKPTNQLKSGQVFSHYKIVRQIGAGGMGEVYLAEDTRLNRRVAVKVLPAASASNKEANRRLWREARAAATLDHPHICAIHEIAESADCSFIVMQYVEGETLSERLKREKLSIREILDLATQVADALAEAHAHSIIHRDIKPANVIVNDKGQAKVLDFGLAKFTAESAEAAESEAATAEMLSKSGVIMGTVPYMSPEQARGKRLDARTDIFSFGALVYEMSCGRSPFARESDAETISAILRDEPSFTKIPVELQPIVQKCLKKKADERYQTAKDLLTDLKELKEELSFRAKLERSSPPNKNAEAETQIIEAAATAKTDARNSIAVLPFSNMSNDAENEYFCDGLAEELLNALAKIDDLKVAARTSAFSFKNKNVEASEIGNALNVKTVLEGSVRRSGNKLRITVQLINAANGYHLWSERYDREMRDIFDVQDEITLAVVDALKVKLFGDEKAAVLKRYTDNSEAYELYLKGRYHYNRHTAENWLKGIEYFEQAIEIEPDYAPAYAWLSHSYSMLDIFGVRAAREIVHKLKAAANRALEIDAALAEAHLALAAMYFYYEWNWAEAEREYRRAAELNPNDAYVHYNYGLLLAITERFDEAISEGKRALELDPLSFAVILIVGWIYKFSNRLDEVLEQARKLLELEPNFHGAYWQMAEVYAARGEYEKAVEFFQKTMDLGGTHVILSKLGLAYGRAGKRDEALGVLNQLLEMRERQYVTAFAIARVYAGLGDNDNAFEWLNKAVEERNGELVLLDRLTVIGTGESWGKNFRADPRYRDILRRVGLPMDEIAQGKTTDETSEARTAMFDVAAANATRSEPPAVAGRSNDLGLRNADFGLTFEQAANPQSQIPNPQSDNPPATAGGSDLSINRKPLFIIGLIISLLAAISFGIWYFGSRPANTKQIESIAVLPFENESGNAETEYLSDGMTETLISSLSQIPKLNVKARSSVFRYKGKEIALPKIGQELNVQAILTGRVVERGQDLTLYIELVDAATENVLWKSDYNRPMSNLAALQTDIARDVSNKLQLKLSSADEKKITKNYTENAEAYRLYLQGRFFWNKRTPKDAQRAIEYFQQAIAVDPNYALGFAGLADAYTLLSLLGSVPPREAMPKAKESALKALSLDAELAEAHTSLALVRMNYDYDFAGAESELRRSLELNPNYTTAHLYYGQLLYSLGRHEESLAVFRRALEIEPFSLLLNRFYGASLIFARRYDEGIAQMKKTLELDSGYPLGFNGLAAAYEAKGLYAESVEAFAKYYGLLGRTETADLMRESYSKGGWQGYLRAMTGASRPRDLRSYVIASYRAALGEKDKAFAELEKSYENREFYLVLLKVDPRLDPLRDDPRFADLLRRVGFTQ